MTLSILAKYECVKCGFQWVQPPDQVTCPKCKHLYIKWLNYDELNEKYFSKYWKDKC